MMKGFLKHLGVFLLTLFILWGFLYASACIPNEMIYENMMESALSYEPKEAFHHINGRLCNTQDNYADVILLDVSWGMGRNPKVTHLDTWYHEDQNNGFEYGFVRSLTEPDLELNTDYSRYWHGSGAFVRILHLFTNVNGIKLIALFFILMLALVTIMILVDMKQKMLALLFGASLVLVQVWNLRLSMEYQSTFIIGFIMCILFLFLERKGDKCLSLASVACGVTTAFFDFLTTESVTFILPLILVVAVRYKEDRLKSFKEEFINIVKCVFGWGFAYVGMFLSKWTLASLVTGENKFTEAILSASVRVAGGNDFIVKDFTVARRLVNGVLANVCAVFGGGDRSLWLFAVVMMLVIALLATAYFCIFKRNKDKTPFALLAILGGAVIVRYLLLSNHSYIHCFFTYRALVSCWFALFVSMYFAVLPGKNKKEKNYDTKS